MTFLRRRWKLLLLGLAVLGLSVKGVLVYLGPHVSTLEVRERPLVQKVVASGRVLPPARISIGSVLTATVSRVLVSEGEEVAAGQGLIELADGVEQASVLQAKAGVAQAQARLGQVARVSSRVAAEGLKQAEAELKKTEEKHRRVKTLAAQGAVSQAELDEATRALEIAESRRQSASVQAAGVQGSEAQVAQAALALARANLVGAEARLAQTRIVAPARAVVLTRAVEPGDIVVPGRTLLVLARRGKTQLLFQPEEKNLAFLRVGQQASASADAYTDQSFPATIASIAPGVDAQRGTIEVKLDVPRPPPYLRPDMTVSVNVEVARRERALSVPADAVRSAASARPWLLVLEGGRAQRRDVRLGLRGDGVVEITGGLRAGERVVLSPDGAVKPGARVRAQPVVEEGPGAL